MRKVPNRIFLEQFLGSFLNPKWQRIRQKKECLIFSQICCCCQDEKALRTKVDILSLPVAAKEKTQRKRRQRIMEDAAANAPSHSIETAKTTDVDASAHTEDKVASAANTRALYITYINIVLYAVCYQLQLPVEPFLVQRLSKHQANDSAAVARKYGQLQATFSAIQTLGSPLVGLLLDRIGIRRASAIVFLASALSYAVLASAKDMNLLFLSKIPTAFQHAFLIAQAVAATTAVDERGRAQALARMTTAYTIGATIGPATGGFLAGNGDLYASARWAVVGSLVSVVLSLFFLPDGSRSSTGAVDGPSSSSLATKRQGSSSSLSFWQDIRHQGSLALRATLLPLLVVKVAGGVAASMHATALPLVLTQDLQFAPALLGAAMSCSMMAVAVFGAVAVAPLTQWLGPQGLAQTGLTLRVLWGSLLAFWVTATTATSNLAFQNEIIIVTWVLRELSSHALATGLTTQTTGAVTVQEQGALLGLEHGLFSMARIVGPPLATLLLTQAGTFWAVAAACGGLDVCLIAILGYARGKADSRKRKSK